jgi:hypothetical protein
MPEFYGGSVSITPNTTNDNWTLNAVNTAHSFGKIFEIFWGGQLTTSQGYATRWTRPTAAGTTPTVITLGYGQPQYVTANANLSSTWTTQPALAVSPSGNLFGQSWNAQGGQGSIVLPLDKEWWVHADFLTGQFSCRNTVGTDASGSSYFIGWKE